MKTYRYAILNSFGRVESFEGCFASDQDLFDSISRNNQLLVSYKIKTYRAVFTRNQKEFWFYMMHLSKCRLPLVDALLLTKDMFSSLAHTIDAVVHSLKGGQSFSQSLEAFPKVFDAVTIDFVRIAESCGHFAPYFEKIYNYLLWREKFSQKLYLSLLYPLVLSTCVIMLMYFITSQLLPEFSAFFTQMLDKDIPTMTYLLMRFGTFFEHIVMPSLIIIVLALVVFRALCAVIPKFTMIKDALALHIPIGGTLYLNLLNGMYLSILSILLAEKMPIIEALQQAKEGIFNTYLKQKYARIITLVESGASLGKAFERVHIFPTFIVKTIGIAEDKNILNETLQHISETMLETTQNKIQFVIKIIEPSILAIMSLMILWVVFAIWVPLYGSIS